MSVFIALNRPKLVAAFVFATLGYAGLALGQPPWQGKEDTLESFLSRGEVLSRKPIGRGVTNPERALIEYQGVQKTAVWKPLRAGYASGYWESYQAEVVAYRLDRFLGLDMVPPTVERQLGSIRGSLQIWLDGCRLFEEVQDSLPKTVDWQHQLARMKFLDTLLYNRDRNAGNFLVDEDWRIYLIDHSRSILFKRHLDDRPSRLPQSYDRQLVERLRLLDRPTLVELLGNLVPKSTIKGLLWRQQALLAHIDQQERVKGPSIFFE